MNLRTYTNKRYAYVKRVLAKYGWISIFLSHGGLHIILLGLLAACFYVMYKQTSRISTINYKELQYAIYFDTYLVSTIDEEYPENSKNLVEFSDFKLELRPNNNNYFIQNGNRYPFELEIDFKHNMESLMGLSFIELKSLQPANDTIYKLVDHTTITRLDNKHSSNEVVATIPKYEIKESSYVISDLYSFNETNIHFRIFFQLFNRNYDELSAKMTENSENGVSSITISLDQSSLHRIKTTNELGEVDYLPLSQCYTFDKIEPQPDFISDGIEVKYTDRKKIEYILNHGLSVMAHNYVNKAIEERQMIWYNILLGAILALMIDVLINLVLKWRKLTMDARAQKSSESGR